MTGIYYYFIIIKNVKRGVNTVIDAILGNINTFLSGHLFLLL
jgi:hypothetical protein